MKTRISAITALGLGLALASARGAATPDSSSNPAAPAAPPPKPPEVVTNAFRPAVLPLAITEARAAQNQPTASNSQPAAAPKVASVWLTELIRLARSAVDEPVLFSFVDSAGTFNLGAEQIIYLRDLGISNDLITTIILHDSEIVSGQREVTVSPIALSRPALAVKLAPPAPPARTRAPEDYDSIIAPDDFTSEEFLPDDLFPNFTAERSAPVRSAADDLYPVRKPYAVPVTEPLVLVNRAARTPNLVTVEMFH